MHHSPVPNPRSFPGLIQVALAFLLMVGFGLLAGALGVPDHWDTFAGIALGSIVLGIWEAFSREP